MTLRSIPLCGWPVLALVLAALLVGCESRSAIDEDTFQAMIETLCDPTMEGRDAGTEGIKLARDYLVAQFKSEGLEPGFVIDGKPGYTQPFELRVGVDKDKQPVMATVENVGAVLPGVGALAGEVVVIGAHYDHVGYGHVGSRDKNSRGKLLHPGADDNASGTAGVVLLARHFAQLAKQDPTSPRRTILFTCFAGEERGLHGSRYMTRHPDQWPFELKQVNGMINLDMVGRLRDGELYVFTDQTGKQWRDWTNEANRDVGLNLQWDVRAPGGSDHSLFIAVGVPAVFFNTWLHPDYHTPADTPDKINKQGGAQVLRLVAGLAERAATEPERIVFVKPGPRPARPYLGVQLGTHERGVLLKGLANNGPMQKAGAKQGDIMLAIAGKAVKTPADLRSYLARAKPGSEVTVRLLREGKEIDLPVKLGRR